MIETESLKPILSYLSPVDVLNMEKAFSNWKEHTTEFWNALCSLDVDAIIYNVLLDKIDKNDIKLLENDLRHTKNLKEIKLTVTHPLLIKESFFWLPNIIARFGHSIEKLNLSSYEFDSEGFEQMSNCTMLKSISLRTKTHENALTRLFQNNPYLIYVSLNGGELLEENLAALSAPIEHLELISFNTLDSCMLVQFIKKWKLRSLSLDSVSEVHSDFIKDLSMVAPELETLALKFISTVNLNYLGCLKKLRRLCFECKGDLKENCLKVIVDNCLELENLKLGSMDTLPPNCLIDISRLPRLTTLHLQYIFGRNKCQVPAVPQLDKLSVVKVFYVEEFDDAAALTLLQACVNLSVLEIKGCDITETFIENASTEFTKQKTMKSVLKIILTKVKVNKEVACKFVHPQLEITLDGQLLK